MKYLIVVFVVVLVAWLVLRGRSGKSPPRQGEAPAALPQAMVQCKHCGVHLPRGDALLDTSRRLLYRSASPGGP